MIVPMKHLTLLCVAEAREQALEALSALETVHLNIGAADSERIQDAQLRLATNQRAQWVLYAAHTGKPVTATASAAHPRASEQHTAQLDARLAHPLPHIEGTPEAKTRAILALADMRQELANEADRLTREILRVQPFGAFDISLPGRLAAQGLPVTLFRAAQNTFPTAPEGAVIQRISEDGKTVHAVLIGTAPLPAPCEAIPLPEMDLNALLKRRAEVTGRASEIEAALKQAFALRDDLQKEEQALKDQCAFATAAATMQEHGAVVWITGWCPAEKADALRQAAKVNAWGLLLRDPDGTELPPTLLRPPRWLSPMQSLFQGLGISPAYNEADVSLPFFAFFSIFFAMLVGDGGYGLLILALALWGRTKVKPTPTARAPFTLLTVFAIATVVWGVLSNTWFGFHPAPLQNTVSQWLSAPGKGDGNMMLICFTLGVAHLSIARLWNAAALFPDTKFLAQVGWVGVIWFMYFMAGNVVGVLPLPGFMKIVFGISVLLIAVFMLKKEELKTGGADLGMLPLNIISCLGDIISYVRLFAVGLAGVKVAENFNEMATGLNWPLYLKIIPMLLILLVGHGLNFAMAALSVLVHAVRLNTLEFSNHKGISWSGIRFNPFRRTAAED